MPKKIAWGGIDPGQSGCACLLTESEIRFHDWYSEARAVDKIDEWQHSFRVKFLLEKQFDVRKKGFNVRGKLLINYGFWVGVLMGLNCSFIEKASRSWQVIIPVKAVKGEDTKTRSLKWANEFYPAAAGMLSRKKDNGRADALLMAHYLRQNEIGGR